MNLLDGNKIASGGKKTGKITLRSVINTPNTRAKRIRRKSGNGKQQVLQIDRQGGALVNTSKERERQH